MTYTIDPHGGIAVGQLAAHIIASTAFQRLVQEHVYL